MADEMNKAGQKGITFKAVPRNVTIYKVDADGKRVKDDDGKAIKVGKKRQDHMSIAGTKVDVGITTAQMLNLLDKARTITDDVIERDDQDVADYKAAIVAAAQMQKRIAQRALDTYNANKNVIKGYVDPVQKHADKKKDKGTADEATFVNVAS